MARLTVRYSISTLLIMVLIFAVSFNLGLRARQAKLDAVEQKLAQTQAELDATKTSLENSRISERVLQATVQLKEVEQHLRLQRAALEKEQPVADAESGKTDRKRQTIDGFIWSCIRVLFHKKTKASVPQRPHRASVHFGGARHQKVKMQNAKRTIENQLRRPICYPAGQGRDGGVWTRVMAKVDLSCRHSREVIFRAILSRSDG